MAGDKTVTTVTITAAEALTLVAAQRDQALAELAMRRAMEATAAGRAAWATAFGTLAEAHGLDPEKDYTFDEKALTVTLKS